MNHATAVAKYCSNIDALSQVVLQGDRLLKKNSGDVWALRVFVSSQLDDVLMQDCTPSLDDLQAYYTGVWVFMRAHGDETAQIQVGRLFGFRPDKFRGNISISSRGPILMISFSDMQDLLYAKFAKRKEQFSHEDKTSGFYKTIHYEGHEIPVCVSFAGHDQPSTIVHELTHFRNDVNWYGFL